MGKNSTMISINDDDKLFQYAAAVALNHKVIGKNSQIISKTKPFINKYNCKRINYSPGKDKSKKFEKNNQTIALNLLYVKNEYISCLHFKTQLKS